MNFIQKWATFTIACSLLGCTSNPTCEDLATCPQEHTYEQPTNGSGGHAPNAGSITIGEDCANEVDDDGDHQTDCADTDCKATALCAEQLPFGFDGFAVISILAIDDPAPSCTNGSEAGILYQNPKQQVCDACACDASNVACVGPAIGLDFQTNLCSSLNFQYNPGVDECVSDDFSSFGILFQSAMTLGEAQVVGGACTAMGGAPIATRAMDTKIAACAVKHPSTAEIENDQRLCMYGSGHLLNCPAGWDAVATNAFTGYIDDRKGCTPCGCNAACSGGDVEVFDEIGCSGNSSLVAQGNACAEIKPTATISLKGKAPTATCTLHGGEPIGSVIPTGEKTFCCKP